MTVRSDTRGGVLTLTLDAPSRRNALSPEMLCRLSDALHAFDADDALKVVIVTGAGEQAFCAGGDLGRTLPLLTGDRAPEDEWDRRVLAEPVIMATSGLRGWLPSKPVIAAVNGVCMAAGLELLLGTDIRLAADHARFALPEVQRGLLPFAGSMARLPRQVPYAVAMQMLLTGDPIDAAEAWRIGLVSEVMPLPALLPRAHAIADRIAANGPLAVREAKQAAIATSGLALGDAYAVEDAAWARVRASDDAREGPRSFMEKRAPRWRGR